MILSPSILAADFGHLKEQLDILAENGINWVHIDVMDGMFVPSISFGMPVIKSIRKESNLFFDTHLMIEEPVRYVEDFKKSGADLLTVHVEACKDIPGTIKKIRESGMKVGLAINPETDGDKVFPYIKDADMILVMSVHPGFGGQKFISDVLTKVEIIRKEIDKTNPACRLQIDGGINADNIKTVVKAGCDTVVCGTAVFMGNIKENIEKIIRNACEA